MMIMIINIIILIILICIDNISSFQLKSRYKRIYYHNNIIMRDGSSRAVFFQIGDRVKVVEDVIHNPPNSIKFSSRGLIGVVKDIWEKCEVGI